jgi:glycosyltransferase involved in cell wall biosynthesis
MIVDRVNYLHEDTINHTGPSMRVLLIYSTANLGGAEIYAINHIDILKDTVEYLVVTPEDSYLSAEVGKLGIPSFEVPITYPKCDIGQILYSVNRIMDRIDQYRPDIVQVHHLPAAMVGSMVSRALDIPLLFNIDSAYIREPYRSFLTTVPSYVLCASHTGYDVITNENLCPPERTFIAEPGTDLSQFTLTDPLARRRARHFWGLDVNKKTIGVAARLVEDKGVQQVVEALPILLKTFGPDLQLVFAGVGPLQEKLKEVVAAQGLENFVRFLGYVSRSDMPQFYKALDVMVLASMREGRPISIMEAIASGIPVVTTPVGDNPRMICSGVNGWLIDHAQSIDIAQGIQRVFEKNNMLTECQQYDKNLRLTFDHVARAKDVQSAYQQIIHEYSH